MIPKRSKGQRPSIWNLEHQQNVIIYSLLHCQHFLKISFKSTHTFLRYFANKGKKRRIIIKAPERRNYYFTFCSMYVHCSTQHQWRYKKTDQLGKPLGFPQRSWTMWLKRGKSGPLCLGLHDLTLEKQQNMDGWWLKGGKIYEISFFSQHIIRNASIIQTLNYYFKKTSCRIRHYRLRQASKNSVKSWRDREGLILQPIVRNQTVQMKLNS